MQLLGKISPNGTRIGKTNHIYCAMMQGCLPALCIVDTVLSCKKVCTKSDKKMDLIINGGEFQTHIICTVCMPTC